MTDILSCSPQILAKRSDGSTCLKSARRPIASRGCRRMLNRQRVLLKMLDDAGGSASHLEVTKWAFVLREETGSHGGPAFYQFLPYKFGPFSFCLFQEAAALCRDGFLEETGRHRWRLLPLGRSQVAALAPAIGCDVDRVVNRFVGKPAKDLFNYVYDRYTWFTVNSQVDPRAKRPVAAIAIYTAGYEGLLVDGFLNGLLRVGMKRLVDVRNNPVSRRYGFHKSTLARLCANVGIEYCHFPQLGVESEDRQSLTTPAAFATLFDRYERVVLKGRTDAVGEVAAIMRREPSVLVCMEAKHTECHRSRLAQAVHVASGLPIRHLELAA